MFTNTNSTPAGASNRSAAVRNFFTDKKGAPPVLGECANDGDDDETVDPDWDVQCG